MIIVPYDVKYENLYSYILERCPNIPEDTPLSIDYKILKLEGWGRDKLIEIQKYLDKNHKGSNLISDVYINNYTKMDFKCMNNHTFKQSWAEITSGSFCKKCYLENKRTNTFQKILEFCTENNLELLSEYGKAKTKMDWKCYNCDKTFQHSWDYIRKKENPCCSMN